MVGDEATVELTVVRTRSGDLAHFAFWLPTSGGLLICVGLAITKVLSERSPSSIGALAFFLSVAIICCWTCAVPLLTDRRVVVTRDQVMVHGWVVRRSCAVTDIADLVVRADPGQLHVLPELGSPLLVIDLYEFPSDMPFRIGDALGMRVHSPADPRRL